MSNPFGNVKPPDFLQNIGGGDISGLPILLNIVLRTLILGAGIFTIFNLIMAGYGFISSGGDPKGVVAAQQKITFSVIGLVVAAGAFVIAGILGAILFGDANAILQLKIFKPS